MIVGNHPMQFPSGAVHDICAAMKSSLLPVPQSVRDVVYMAMNPVRRQILPLMLAANVDPASRGRDIWDIARRALGVNV